MELKHAMDQITSGPQDFEVGQEHGLFIQDELFHQECNRSSETEFLGGNRRRNEYQDDEDDSSLPRKLMRYEDEEDSSSRENIDFLGDDDFFLPIMKYEELTRRISELVNSSVVVMENHEGILLKNGHKIPYDEDETNFYFYDPNKSKKLKVDICNCKGTSDGFGCQRLRGDDCLTLEISFIKVEEESKDELDRILEKAWLLWTEMRLLGKSRNFKCQYFDNIKNILISCWKKQSAAC
eukprot:GHVP01070544.1.p1 GENE.GHVP01070544.1~~GHVP01070544.1.p1  ORF type:complete len:238 (+),score=47.51 GHVP01070544.1:707-1420(+)